MCRLPVMAMSDRAASSVSVGVQKIRSFDGVITCEMYEERRDRRIYAPLGRNVGKAPLM